MLYFANPTGNPAVHDAMTAGTIGFIDTPLQGNRRPPGVRWCADNGCFNDATFDLTRWWGWLQDNAYDARNCVFAVAPDVVGDADATLQRSWFWLPLIRHLGYRAAYVAQDGLTPQTTPWGEFDVLFIGGTTEWKLGKQARAVVAEARRRGLYIHGGRVNSYRRFRYMETIGCDSVDGTYLTFGPEINLPRLETWLRRSDAEPFLFTL